MPLYLIDSRLALFVHVPKAGGTTVEFALDKFKVGLLDRGFRPGDFRCSPQHFHGEMLKSILDFSAVAYAFMTVRHPMERLKSEYHWHRHYMKLELAFEPWALSCLSKVETNRFFGDNHFRPMVDFQCPGCEWFRLEDGLNKVFDRLNDVFPTLALPRFPNKVMTSQHTDDARPSAEVEALVNRIYREDFLAFGY